MMSSEVVYRVGVTRTRRAFMFRLSKVGLTILSAAMLIALVVMVLSQSAILLAVFALTLTVLYLALRIPKDPLTEPLLERRMEKRRAKRAIKKGWDSFARSEDMPLPRAVGDLIVLGVAKGSDDPEQAIVRQSPLGHREGTFFTSTLEVAGRGDGVRTPLEDAVDAAGVEGLLTRLAEPGSRIDEISFMTRAMPGLQRGFREKMSAAIPERLRASLLAENKFELLDILSATADEYRSFVTISMSTESLIKALGRREIATRDRIAEEAHSQVGLVSRFLEDAGFTVVGGLGPRRLGALIRHLYMPSYAIDDLTGIDTTLDGFPDYPAPLDDVAFTVLDPTHDVAWQHSTGHIDETSWPMEIHESRWLQPLVTGLVTDDQPSVIRTVTTTYRLIPTAEAKLLTMDELLNDAIEVAGEAGKISDGSSSQQADGGRDRLVDFLTGSAGCRVSTRITISAPSIDGIDDAREQVSGVASKMGIEKGITWADHRQGEAFLLSLPLGRGIPRNPPSWLERTLGRFTHV